MQRVGAAQTSYHVFVHPWIDAFTFTRGANSTGQFRAPTGRPSARALHTAHCSSRHGRQQARERTRTTYVRTTPPLGSVVTSRVSLASAMSTQVFDAVGTARLTPFRALVDALKSASIDYASGLITSPERLIVPLSGGGVMLSMPATASDLAIHKLVTVCQRNAERALPTIHGQVMAVEPDTGRMLFTLDGPTVTGRRTAAVSMLGIETLAPRPPRDILLIGTGTQAVYHLQAIGELYPDAVVRVRGTSLSRAQAFCESHRATVRDLEPLSDATPIPDSVDTVITLTTSRQAVYDEPPRADRLVIGVGAFTREMCEVGPRTLAGSTLFVDDLAGAKHEAGDFLQVNIDWSTVSGINGAVSSAPSFDRPIVFKTVGCAAWDLAAGRLARAQLTAR